MAVLRHIEIHPHPSGFRVKHVYTNGSRDHTFTNAEAVGDHIEDVLSPGEEAAEPPMSAVSEAREERQEGEAPPAVSRRMRRHLDLSPMGIGRKAPVRP